MHSIACAILFMTTYHEVLPFPAPITLPRTGFTRYKSFPLQELVSAVPGYQLGLKSWMCSVSSLEIFIMKLFMEGCQLSSHAALLIPNIVQSHNCTALMPWMVASSVQTRTTQRLQNSSVPFLVVQFFLEAGLVCAAEYFTGTGTDPPFARLAVEFMAGQAVAESSKWQPSDSRSLPDMLKDFTEGVASLPRRLEQQLGKIEAKRRKDAF